MELVRITAGTAVEGEGSHPDLALAAAVLQRDRKATAEWVDRFSGPIYAYVQRRLLPRTDLVDDIVQDVFVAAWQYLPGYRGTSPLGAWLMGIARHKIEDHYRGRLRAWESWDDDTPELADLSAAPADEVLDRARLSERTHAVIAALPEHYAAALLWRYWERRSAQEISAATGRSEKAVERLLARARESFRRRWENG